MLIIQNKIAYQQYDNVENHISASINILIANLNENFYSTDPFESFFSLRHFYQFRITLLHIYINKFGFLTLRKQLKVK